MSKTDGKTRDRHKNDLYRTPNKLTKALLKEISLYGLIFEPCADGTVFTGSIASELFSSGLKVKTGDIRPEVRSDLTFDAACPISWKKYVNFKPDFVVTNPPYDQASDILRNCYHFSNVGVYMLLRVTFCEPCQDRADWLKAYADNQTLFMPVSPRPALRADTNGSDNVTLAWFGWRKDFSWNALGLKSPFVYLSNWQDKP